jgi:hypothetical protein
MTTKPDEDKSFDLKAILFQRSNLKYYLIIVVISIIVLTNYLNYMEINKSDTSTNTDSTVQKLGSLSTKYNTTRQNEEKTEYDELIFNLKNSKRAIKDKIKLCQDYIAKYETKADKYKIKDVESILKLIKFEQQKETWKDYESKLLGIRVNYPSNWTIDNAKIEWLIGKDGYVFFNNCILTDNLLSTAKREMETENIYGKTPELRSLDIELMSRVLNLDSFNIDEAYLINSSVENGTCCIIIKYPPSMEDKENYCLKIYADREHIESILYSIDFM